MKIKTNICKIFTLVEMTVVAVIVALIFVLVINLYFRMLRTRLDVDIKSGLIQNSYYILERLNIIMKDFTIDYEEYFDRRIVGCSGSTSQYYGDNFKWYTSGYCKNFTAYGNQNGFLTTNNNQIKHQIYYCSSITGYNSLDENKNIAKNTNLINGSGCYNGIANVNGQLQSYGQYFYHFRDMKDDGDGTGGVVNDDDDVALGKGPVAIGDNNHVQEIYLISKDKKKRLLIRRVLQASGDWNKDGITGNVAIDKFYNLQMLRLRGFDAGDDHVFNGNDAREYDGKIDTRACDYGEGYLCLGTSVGGGYDQYKLPLDINDGRVNIFNKNITIDKWNLEIYPVKDISYAWAEDNMQINPYIKIYIQTKIYGENWTSRINPAKIESYQLDLQTTFNIKSNY